MKTFFVALSLLFSCTLIGQELMTIGEVFNFEINDEFHYRGTHEAFQVNPPNAIRHRIIDKQFSENNDSVYYTVYDFSYSTTINSDQSLNYEFSHDTIVKYYTNLDHSIDYFDTTFEHDTIFETFTCGRTVNGYSYSEGDFEPSTISKKYGYGLGEIYYYIEDGGEYDPFSKELFYYKKGETECGTPDLLTNIKSESILSFDIYPNPVHQTFTIDITQVHSFDVNVYDLTGRAIIKKHNQKTIDISNLLKGTYIIEIISNHGTATKKIMKI